MARTAWPTVASGDAWTASQHNTYGRDNDAAYWVFTTAGDMAYASTSSTLARLALGAAGTILTSSGSVPQWSAKNTVPGMLGVSATVDFAPAQTFAGTWADITGATRTLVLGATSTVLVLATVTGYNTLAGSGRGFAIRAMVDGVADTGTGNPFNGSANPTRNEDLGYVHLKTGVASGSRIVKLQCQADSDANFVTSGRLIALAIVE